MRKLFVVIELQNNGEQISNLVTSHNNLQDAQSKFHSIASSAAISTVPKHSVVLLDDDGMPLDRCTFEHLAEELETES